MFSESEEGDVDIEAYVEEEDELFDLDLEANHGHLFSLSSISSDKEKSGRVNLCKDFKGKGF